jgi:hypothetical protein
MVLGLRRLSGAVTVLAGMAHSAALWIVFTGEGAPGPAFGVWLALSLRRRSRLGRDRRGPEAPDL